ncbi:hypothetical protein H0H92_003797 [Tricholoma furcatifolium]|nr:hypothetical protein H0H92_003797 [Tricholoma furcatifolium]
MEINFCLFNAYLTRRTEEYGLKIWVAWKTQQLAKEKAQDANVFIQEKATQVIVVKEATKDAVENARVAVQDGKVSTLHNGILLFKSEGGLATGPGMDQREKSRNCQSDIRSDKKRLKALQARYGRMTLVFPHESLYMHGILVAFS